MGSSVSHSKETIPEKSIKSEKKEKIDVEIGDARGSQSYVQRVLGLQIMLRQSQLRTKICQFVNVKWEPTLVLGYSKDQIKKVAINNIYFCCDVADFGSIPQSYFQYIRAYHIYEKYVIHGALNQVLISPNTIDECADVLMNSNYTDRSLKLIFRTAETEALDYIISEIYGTFEQSSVLLGRRPSQASITLSRSIRGSFSRARRSSISDGNENEQYVKVLRKILIRPELSFIFKAHVKALGGIHYLYAYNEAIEIYELLKNLTFKQSAKTSPNQPEESDGEGDVSKSLFFHYINGFYDKYIARSSDIRLDGLSEPVLDKIVALLAKCTTFDSALMLFIQESIFDNLMVNYLDSFTTSIEYRQLIRSGRSSLLLLPTAVKDGDSHSNKHPLATDAPEQKDSELEIMAADLNESRTRMAVADLTEIVSNPEGPISAEFLEVKCIDNTVLASMIQFLQCVHRLENDDFADNDMERNLLCLQIFNRFVKRNAEEQIGLAVSIRQSIVADILTYRVNLYSEAAEYIKEVLVDIYYNIAKYHIDKIRAKYVAEKISANESLAPAVEGRRKSVTAMTAARNLVGKVGRRLSVYARITPAPSTDSSTANSDSAIIDEQKSSDESSFRISSSGSNDNVVFSVGISLVSYNSQCDQRLLTIIENPRACSLFKEFLDRNGKGSQTLVYLFEVEEYKRLSSPTFQQLKAQSIYNKYLHAIAVLPLPVGIATKHAISKVVTSDQPYPSNLFRKSVEEVLSYIEKVQYNSFMKVTQEYNKCIVIVEKMAENTRKGRRNFSVTDVNLLSLGQILRYQSYTKFFKEHCIKTFCHESLFFWLDAENYANIPGSDYMYRMAYRICRKYIFDNAKSPVNISGATKSELLKQLPAPTRSIFKKAQEEIFLLLERDVMQRFRSSKDYAAMIQFHLDSCGNDQGHNIAATNSTRSTIIVGEVKSETQSKFQRVLSRLTSVRGFQA